MKTLICSGLASVLFAAAPALDDHGARESVIDHRQHQLERRITEGWQSGELSPREFRRLQHALHEINQAEHFYRSDGHLSRRERDTLHARLDQLTTEVYVQKHDGERRYGSYNQGHRFESRH